MKIEVHTLIDHRGTFPTTLQITPDGDEANPLFLTVREAKVLFAILQAWLGCEETVQR